MPYPAPFGREWYRRPGQCESHLLSTRAAAIRLLAHPEMAVPSIFRAPQRAAPIAAIASSYERWFGKPLVSPSADLVAALWDAPFALLAHGTQTDPLFFFASRRALERFGYAPDEFVGLPSRLSAEPPARDERREMLERVTRDGFIDDYAGIRIGASGERFMIEKASV
jgi:PAS domain-containing protein